MAPEALALQRWREKDFLGVERDFAQQWRTGLARPFDALAHPMIRWRDDQIRSCATLEAVKQLASEIVTNRAMPHERLGFLGEVLSLTDADRNAIFTLQRDRRFPWLDEIAPYAAYLQEVEVFFRIATAKTLLSPDRANSNRADIAYFFYLPFCEVFVSSDRLHRRCFPSFKRGSQELIWGPDLKADLGRINAAHQALPEATRKNPSFTFAGRPPPDRSFLVTRLWDKYRSNWRELPKLDFNNPEIRAKLQAIVDRDFVARKPVAVGVSAPAEVEAVSMQRMVRLRRGNWTQMSDTATPPVKSDPGPPDGLTPQA